MDEWSKKFQVPDEEEMALFDQVVLSKQDAA
jgi:hypothetical protein